MRKAFTLCFLIDHLDDPELWHYLNLEDQPTVDAVQEKQTVKKKRKWQFHLFQIDQNSAHCRTRAQRSNMCLMLNLGNKEESLLLSTRWDSTLQQVKAVLSCDYLKLCHVLGKAGHKGEIVTISSVVPSVLSLNHHLKKLRPQVRFPSGLISSLQASHNKRFLGISINVKMSKTQDWITGTASFPDPVYETFVS